MYDPIAGQQKLWEWNAASRTWGVFAQDTWTARRNLTVTLGFRFDNQGNPYSRTDYDGLRQFLSGERRHFPGAGGQRRGAAHAARAQGFTEGVQPARRRRPGTSREGRLGRARRVGIYCQLADVGERAGRVPRQPSRADPARPSSPDVDARPIFTQGTAARRPSDSRPQPGGLGAVSRRRRVSTQGRDRGRRRADWWHQSGLESPTTYIYSAASCTRSTTTCRRALLYSGSHSTNLVSGGNQAGLVSYGVDINALPGDLLTKPPGSPPTRLNSSFGPIAYADNDRVGNYNGITFDFRGRSREHSSTPRTRARAPRTMPGTTRRPSIRTSSTVRRRGTCPIDSPRGTT